MHTENGKKHTAQLQILGDILDLLEKLDVNEIELITHGSHLGKVVSLMRKAKETLNLAQSELRQENSAANEHTNSQSIDLQAKDNQPELDPKKAALDYLKKVFSDTELFPDRKSIINFFAKKFGISYSLAKEARIDLISKLCRTLLNKSISIEEIGRILIKETNSKYGELLIQQNGGFLKNWYDAIERM